MSLPALLSAALLLPLQAIANDGAAAPAGRVEVAARADLPDSEHLEKELQGLSWKQFKAVVYAVPKLRADVDAFGPLGWQYVQDNYKTYGWRRNIDRLKASQKKQLAELISQAKGVKVPAGQDAAMVSETIRP